MTQQPRLVLFCPHDSEPSGAPRVTLRLAEAFEEFGQPAAIAFPARLGLEDVAIRGGLRTFSVENPAVSLAGRGGLWGKASLGMHRVRGLAQYLSVIRRPEIGLVWAGSSVAILPVIAARVAGKPAIVHIHEDLTPTRGNRLRIALLKKCAAALVFVAAHTQAPFGERPPLQPWVLLPNWTEPARAIPPGTREAIRRELDTPTDSPVFVTLAFISRRKGIDLLLQAFAKVLDSVPGAHLWIAGATPDDQFLYSIELREYAKDHAMEERVHFTGHRDDGDALLAAADGFVLASRNEALPLTILEAMQARCPVVATDVGGVAEVVRPGETGWLVPAEDVAALAGAMAELATNPEEAGARAARAAELVREAYSKAHVIKEALDLARGFLYR
ncbi:MAG: glycosyltransferase family 4 protein [Sumerlaeia bacterium]